MYSTIMVFSFRRSLWNDARVLERPLGEDAGRRFVSSQRLAACCEPADSTWSRGSQSSHRGRYQFQAPSSFMALGSTTERMIVASIRSATATPKPICWNMISSPLEPGENGDD